MLTIGCIDLEHFSAAWHEIRFGYRVQTVGGVLQRVGP